MAQHQQILVIEPEELETARAIAKEQGVELHELPIHGLEPIATASILLLGSTVAVATVGRVLDQRKGGQVIDVRAGSPRVLYRSRDVAYGLVVLIAADGTVTIDVHQPQDMFHEVCSALHGIVSTASGADVRAVAERAIAALPAAAEVDVRTHELPA